MLMLILSISKETKEWKEYVYKGKIVILNGLNFKRFFLPECKMQYAMLLFEGLCR